MICAVADTHTLIWYLYNDARLSSTARAWKISRQLVHAQKSIRYKQNHPSVARPGYRAHGVQSRLLRTEE